LSSRSEYALTIAFLSALIATLGALFIGEVLGQAPCALCWYQRIFMFPLVPILAVALWRGDARVRAYALPLAAAGLVAALWHSGLYAGLLSEELVPCTREGLSCTDRVSQTILGLSLPYLSLAAFSVIGLCLLIVRESHP
jgi:disulfide bond formation protein DsbB